MKIYKELARIQQELKAPKNLFNKFGNYYYRNAEGILESVKPLLNGLALVINDEPVMIGPRFYIKATVTLTDGDESVSAVAYAREDEAKKGMDGCQITGACSSYARKYALNALLMIDDSKDSDDDSLSPKNPENQQQVQRVAKPAQVTTAATVPQMVQVEEVKKEPSPVQIYLLNATKELREMRNISCEANNKLFRQQLKALIEKGLVPNKELGKFTMDEAVNLIDLMYKRFDPTGTVVKE